MSVANPAVTPPLRQPPPDNHITRSHIANVNELLAGLGMGARPDRTQAAYLMAYASILTRFAGPRGLLEYARDLCSENQPVSREALNRIRVAATHYGLHHNIGEAIQAAEAAEL